MIEVRCGNCGAEFLVDDASAGKSVKCAKCDAMVVVNDGGGTSGMAVAALICGILGFCMPFLFIVAIVLGIVGIVVTGKAPLYKSGKGMAITGVILGAVAAMFWLMFMASIIIPSFSHAREAACRVVSRSNINHIIQCMWMYEEDYNGQIPPDLGVLVIGGYMIADGVVRPPSDTVVPRFDTVEEEAAWVNENSDYVYCAGRLGVSTFNDIVSPSNTIILYERIPEGEWKGICIGFADGHVEFARKREALKMLRDIGESVP